jgi:hypothetical protein
MSVSLVLLSRCLMHSCKILEQHTVYEDVPTTNFAKKDTSGSIVEEANVMERGEIFDGVPR